MSEPNVRRYLRTHRICYPPDYRQLAERGLAPRKIRSFVGCSLLFHAFPNATQWVLAAHGANQRAHFLRHGRSTRLTVVDLPGPEQAKAFPVPAYDGRGFDDKEAGLPVVPDGAQPGPQPPIRRCQFGSFDGALQNAELMTEREDLQLERRAAPEGSENRGQESGQ